MEATNWPVSQFIYFCLLFLHMQFLAVISTFIDYVLGVLDMCDSVLLPAQLMKTSLLQPLDCSLPSVTHNIF
jgi:hypothetical protein